MGILNLFFPRPLDTRVNGFDWDAGNQAKCQKHGVPIAIIESVFVRTVSIIPDLKHSQAETRFLAIGKTEEGRGVFLAFTLRRKGNAVLIRPVSARYMSQQETTRYDQTPAPFDH